MKEFSFKLPKAYDLVKTADGCYITAKRPKRQIQLSPATYDLLNLLLQGEQLKNHNLVCGQKEIAILFTLGAKGYLQIRTWAALDSPDSIDSKGSKGSTGIDGVVDNQKFNQDFDKDLPKVSVIIPVKDRPLDIADCLNSLAKLVYPKSKLEIIVVDDGSVDETPQVAAALGAKVVKRAASGGPSAARNSGVQVATGEVIAFLDSDCTVDEGWLLQLLPWLMSAGIGAVGGFVASYYNSSALDKYEAVMSSLSMGKRLLYEGPGKGNFYVPTCNILVRKAVYDQVGGLNPEMHLGEDVDLCWRLREAGFGLVYVTEGRAWHKHRSILGKMLKRRLQYGTSEADLYKRHQSKRKLFPLPLLSLGVYLSLFLTVVTFQPWFLLIGAGCLVCSYCQKFGLAKKLKQPPGLWELAGAVWRNAVAFCYYFNFHIIRYYLIILLILCCFLPNLLIPVVLALFGCALVDYLVKKPQLDFFRFSFFYVLEQMFYQVGVFVGCIQHRYFRCYIVKWLITI